MRLAERPVVFGEKTNRVRAVLAEIRELDERLYLVNRPWEEEFLHWARDEHGWHLHGHRVPPSNTRIRSITSTGWCPGLGKGPGNLK